MWRIHIPYASGMVLTLLHLYLRRAGACKLPTAGEEHHLDPHVCAVICGDLVVQL